MIYYFANSLGPDKIPYLVRIRVREIDMDSLSRLSWSCCQMYDANKPCSVRNY